MISLIAHDTSHHPSLAYLPYLVSGDYYYLEELHKTKHQKLLLLSSIKIQNFSIIVKKNITKKHFDNNIHIYIYINTLFLSNTLDMNVVQKTVRWDRFRRTMI
jgi:ribosome-interacting GTPase 1